MFRVMFVNGSGALAHLDGPSVVVFDPSVHAEHVSCIQVWGDIVIVGHYDDHGAMFRDYEKWSLGDGVDLASFCIPMFSKMFTWTAVFVERQLACVVRRDLEGVWVWNVASMPFLHPGYFETPLGSRPAMRYLFAGLGIAKIV